MTERIRQQVQLDEKTRKIIESRKRELVAQTGTGSVSAAIRSIIIEWDFERRAEQRRLAAQTQEQTTK